MRSHSSRKPKTGRLRFGLKSALLAVLISSLFLAWFGGKLNEARSEAGVLQELYTLCEQHEVRVRHKYDYELLKQNILMNSREPYGPRWVRSIFGDYTFSRVHELEFIGANSSGPRDPLKCRFAEELTELDLSSLKHLRRIQFSGWEELDNLSMLAGLTELEELKFDGCEDLKSLDGIERLTQLKTVIGPGFATRLRDVEAVRGLQQLELIRLDVEADFARTENWSALSQKPELLHLSLRSPLPATSHVAASRATSPFLPSPNLKTLAFDNVDPGLENLGCCKEMPELLSLRIVASPTLTSLKGIEHCQNLERLVIHDCPNLNSVEEIKHLENLTLLSIASPRHLSIPELQCRQLGSLALRELRGFEDLQFLKNTQDLRALDVCRSGLKSFKGLSHLTSLEELLSSGCDVETIGCEEFKAPLNRLDLSWCSNLVDLTGIENCKNVKTVLLKGCSKLERLTGLGQMDSLEYLDLSGCTAIESLDDLVAVPRLHHVSVDRCGNLKDVSGLLRVDKLGVLEWEDCPQLKPANVKPLLEKFRTLDAWPDVRQRH